MHAGLLALAFTLSDDVQWQDASSTVASYAFRNVAALLDNLSCFIVLVTALSAIQAAMAASRARVAVMIVSVVALGIAVPDARLLMFWRRAAGIEALAPDMDFYALHIYLAWGAIATGTLLVMFYEWQARLERIAEAIGDARIAAEVIERSILDARLSSLKAKVDPTLLFTVVGRAQVLYLKSADAAESLLESLIDFLRASLPHSKAMSVTLEQEVLLCRSYVQLRKAMDGDVIGWQVRVDTTIGGYYFPPSVLLSLVQAMTSTAEAAGRPHFSICAERVATFIRIELAGRDGLALPPRESLDAALAALSRFFGQQVSVVACRTAANGHLVRIEVPDVSPAATNAAYATMKRAHDGGPT